MWFPFKATLLHQSSNALGTPCLISLEAHVKSIQGVLGRQSGWRPNQEAIKPAQTKLSLTFCVFTGALCQSVCHIWCCLSIFIAVLMASKQQQAFMMCVLPCPMGGDTHNLCVACLGEEHICRSFPLRKIQRYASLTDAPIPPGVLSRGRSGSRSPGLWSRYCWGTA